MTVLHDLSETVEVQDLELPDVLQDLANLKHRITAAEEQPSTVRKQDSSAAIHSIFVSDSGTS